MKALITLIFLTSSTIAQDQPSALKLTSQSCGQLNVQFQVKSDLANHPLGEIAPGKALVYVIEDQKTKVIRDVTIRVGMDGAWMGANRGSSYMFFAVEPGTHHLCADWVTESAPPITRIVALANLKAEESKIYYFRARTLATVQSLWVGHSNLEPILDLDAVNDDEGQLLVASSNFSASSQKK